MIAKSFAIFIALLVAGLNSASAIQCNFKFVEDNLVGNISTATTTTTTAATTTGSMLVKPKPTAVFNCDDVTDEYEPITGVKPMGFETRFGDDDYEPAGSDCVSVKKTIEPKALNNIYNKLMNLVKNASFVQSIGIDECGNRNEPCLNGNIAPKGKKILCRQKYVTITLKAYADNGNIVDEQFYYPSHCICELVQKKGA